MQSNTISQQVEYIFRNVTFNSKWVIYDAESKTLIDKCVLSDSLRFDGKGGGIPSYFESLKQTAYYAGAQYAKRISSHWLDVKRDFYKHGNGFGQAYKEAIKKDDWKDAKEIWRSKINSTNKKIAGKACFNLAVANEREGKLNEALAWANQAKQSGNKHAEKYIAILNKRLSHK